MANKPIFFDASGRRAARIRLIGWVVGLAAAVILAGFVTSLALSPPVTGLDLPGRAVAVNPPNLIKRAQKPGLLARAERLAAAARKRRLVDFANLRRGQSSLPSRVLPAILKPQAGRPLAIGFYTNWGGKDDPSWASLKRSLGNLDWVIPSWVQLDRPQSRLQNHDGQAGAGFYPSTRARSRHPAHGAERQWRTMGWRRSGRASGRPHPQRCAAGPDQQLPQLPTSCRA